MNKNILLTIIGLGAVGLIASYVIGGAGQSSVPVASAHEATVYREATCGCCGAYLSYLKKQGFSIDDNVVSDMGAIKEQYGVEEAMMSCHTAIIEGYVVEGHMPVEAINKLMSEHPEISGIALPGMPSGSPGMPGAKRGMFEVHSLMADSEVGDMMFMSL